ncbi:pyruvate dehydrogenase complex dihydrolipoamide acetyltransferase [Candidatus Trichorickettsia mobilis]|uniref:pyruvate dehydrogenase complex dihydrolipoamide acetyltransferase n=1 Tax=Candidatus Trichorickettsia mobilis TaxID=1346319 RepID=UPI00292F693A|nr:pyruvate dehydrogenase complex dihydrolipoamide acetyltransferase [Candidatus Trichorickettsia mobilis]
MPIKILMPALSPTMTSGNLTKWLKQEGDKVSSGEVIVEIETDKATMEVEAVDEGIMGKIICAAGSENIAVNSLIAVLLEEGEDAGMLEGFIQAASAVAGHSSASDNPSAGGDSVKPVEILASAEITETAVPRIFASPLAKKIAAQSGVNLANISGSGPHGRIIKSDILAAQSSSNNCEQNLINSKLSRNTEEYRAVPNSNVRKIIAKRLLESKQTIPHFYLSIECNVDKLLALRQELNSAGTNDSTNKVSVNDFVILAMAKALREVGEANASWQLDAIHYYNNVDISVAVAIAGGLITPVIKSADKKDIISLSNEVKDLAKRARENKLLPEEFQGGGFTISNLGMYGIKNFSAIINPPQSCILAVGESVKRPVIINDQITIATMMELTLSCDHRVVDGVIGAKLLAAFKKLIERPILMLV